MSAFVPGLYVVATPIGNLGDLSPRALLVLGAASLLAAEDTRVSGKLLKLAGGTARLVSLTEHNVLQRSPALVSAAREGVVALVSDAGTPVVADPGARLVDAAHAAASAASVLVFFESPNRLSAVLGELAEILQDPEVAVCRELTKVHEEVVRGRASELAARFESTRGECTVVVRIEPAANGDLDAVRGYMAEMQRAGARRSGAAAEAARRFSVGRQAAYGMWTES